jgi:hypothetical protein
MLVDFVTGRQVPNVGVEERRQAVERFLVESKGYDKKDIEVDATLEFDVAGERYRSHVDLVVAVGSTRFMVFKVASGSLGSRHRETLAAARLLDAYQIPLSVVTNGEDAEILDSAMGELIEQGMEAIPSAEEARRHLKTIEPQPYPKEKIERERIIFRSYDEMNVNVQSSQETENPAV